MAGNFKGLTIEITGDATQLESVLLSIKRTSRSVQSEVEAVGRAMKVDPNNTALAAKYYDAMGEKLALTRKQAETMRAEQAKLNEKIKEYQQVITGLPAGSDAYKEVEQKMVAAQAEQQELTAKLADYKAQLKTLKGDADAYEKVRAALQKAEEKQVELTDKINLCKMEMQGLEKDSEAYKTVERELKKAEKSQGVLNERIKVYRSNLESLSKNAGQYKILKTNIQLAEERQKELTAEVEKYRRQLDGLEEGSDAYKKMQQQIEKTEYKLRDLSTQLLTTQTDIKQLESTMRLLDIKNATTGLAGWGNDLVDAGSGLQAIGDQFASFASRYTNFMLIAAPLAGRKLIGSVEEYGNVISQIGGYLDITGDKLEGLSELALYTGKETIYSATEAGEAISNLAKGGMTEAQIRAGALDATVSLAAAGQLDLADAAKVTAQAIAAFQLEAEDATDVADALAGAATNSVSSVQGIATGFTQAASWARAAGWSINDVAGALALLSDYGLEAEMGGTALRNVLLRLAAPTDEAASAMEAYGIEVRDADGHMKSAVDVVQNLSDAMAGMNDEERDTLVKTVFGTRGANAALALVDAGSAKLQEYIGYTKDAGAAGRMAQAQLGDLGWAMELLRGEAETAMVNFGEAITPMLVELAHAAEGLLTQFNSLSKSEREVVARNALLTLGLPVAINLFGRMTSGVGGLTVGLGKAVLGFAGWRNAVRDGVDKTRAIAEAFAAASGGVETTADMMGKAKAVVGGLSAGLTGLGIALGALVIGGTVAAFVALLKEEQRRAREAAEHTEKLEDATDGLRRTIRDTAPNVEDVTDAYRRMGQEAENVLESTDNLMDEFANMSTSIQDRNSKAQESISTLVTAKDIINEYADAESLSTEQAAKLQWALSTLNSELGTNYELLDKNKGIVGENGEAVDGFRDSINKLIDARIRDAQVAAITQNMTEMFQAQSKAQAAVDATTAAIEENRREFAMWDAIFRDTHSTEAAQHMYDLNMELNDLNVALDDNKAMLDAATDGVGQYADQLEDVMSEIRTWDDVSLNLNTIMGDAFSGLGDRSDEFLERLQNAGISVSDFTSMTKDEFAALVTALNADGYYMEDMLALVTGNLSLAKSDWGAIIDEWASDMGLAPQEAMDALAQGIRDGEVDVSGSIEDILASAKEYIENKQGDFDDAAEQAVGGGMGSGIDKGKETVDEKTKRVRSSIESTLNSMNLYPSGRHMMQNLGSGIDSGRASYVTPAIAGVMSEIRKLEHSKPKYGPLKNDDVWGLHMMQNFASGMRKGLPYIEREIDALTGTLAGSLDDQSLYMSASTAQQVTVINIDGMRVNDDIGIRQNVIDMAYALKAKERGYVGKTDYRG